MTHNAAKETELPPPVQEGLVRFCGELAERLGEDLISVVLYGGVARGDYASRTSDVNVMVVVREATIDVLDKAVSPVQRGVRDFRLSVMLLTEEDLRGSADVFPTKFLDMQQRHRVLWGADVLPGLDIGRDHLRLRCEQEIKNLLLRLRQFYLHRAHRPELVEGILVNAVSSLVGSLGVLLVLKNGEAPTCSEAIVERAGREFGLDVQAIDQVLALRSGEHQPDGDDLKRLYDAFMAAAAQVACVADRI